MGSEYVVKRSPSLRANQHLLTKDELSPEEQRAVEEFMDEFGDSLDGPERDLLDRIQRGEVNLSRLDSIRAEVESAFGNYTGEIQSVFRDQLENATRAGRELAARRHDLSGSFGVVPDRLMDSLDEHAIESTNEVVDTMSEDVSRVLRSAAEEGEGVDDMAQRLQDDVFDNRLRDSKAEEVAQTEVVSASNEGAQSAYEDASGVIAEEWIAANDNATRDAHAAADGQIVPVDGTFWVGGEELAHPGDKSGSPGNIVRCRCTIVPVFADDLSESQVETIMDGGRLNVDQSASAPTVCAC